MARPAKHRLIQCQHFNWRMYTRNGVWYADGRSAAYALGKHSLGTRDRRQADEMLERLDVKMAIELGLAQDRPDEPQAEISIADGWTHYLEHVRRPDVLGGASPKTHQRYTAVRDKHLQFCLRERIQSWNQIDTHSLEKYGAWLARDGYADRSIYLELTLVKSLHKWLCETDRLPAGAPLRLKLRRPEGTDTYCYTGEEVQAMVDHCCASESLRWLADVITALACTGLRISELAALRQSDVDLTAGTIHLTDERGGARRRALGTARRTKGRRSRALPIHPSLRRVLERLPIHQDGRLFHGPRGGRLKPDTVRNVLVREVIQSLKVRFPTPPGEIGFVHGRVHSFRHFFVSQCFRAGVDEGEIKSWVGHRDSRMVAHYRHLRSEESQQRMQQVTFLGQPEPADGPRNRTSQFATRGAEHGNPIANGEVNEAAHP